MSWIIQIRAWEQRLFGKRPFCPPHENLMFTMRGGKGAGILGIPRMQLTSKRSFPSWVVHFETRSPDSAPQQGFGSTKVEKQSSKAGACQGSPIEDFKLTSVSMKQRMWKPRMEGNLRSPNPILCLMQESLSQHSFMACWSAVASWIRPRTKNSLPLNSRDNRWHHMEDLLRARLCVKPLRFVIFLMLTTTLRDR